MYFAERSCPLRSSQLAEEAQLTRGYVHVESRASQDGGSAGCAVVNIAAV